LAGAPLAPRGQSQARDLFDLHLLLNTLGGEQPLPAHASADLAAMDNALAIDYDSFAGQVLAYPEPEYQEHYGKRKVWAHQSAPFHHGLIEQIPCVINGVTPVPPGRLRTPVATISFDRMPPELFKGFELLLRSNGYRKYKRPTPLES
jgi:hypothetical protein